MRDFAAHLREMEERARGGVDIDRAWRSRSLGLGRRGRTLGGIGGGGAAPLPTLAGPGILYIGGQSNADGPTESPASPPALPRADIRCSVYVGGTIDGSSPRSLDLFTNKGAEVGVGVTVANAGRSIAISKWGYNATSMLSNHTPWVGNASASTTVALLSDAVVQTRTFIDQLITENSARQPYVMGAFWSQWESDAAGTLANAQMYVQELRVWIERVRAEFHPDLPIYISAVSDNFAGDPGTYTPDNLAAIEAAHAAVVSEYDYVYLVDTDGLTMKVDGIHYTADSQLTLGTDRLAPLVLAAPVPNYLDDTVMRRVSLYTTEAAAITAADGAPVYMSPCDDRAWAVADPAGAHFVPIATWPVAEAKAVRWFPNTQEFTAGKVIGGSIPNADIGLLNAGSWHIEFEFGWVSTSETTLRIILSKSTAYRLYYLGSSKQLNLRLNSTDALGSAMTFAVGDRGIASYDDDANEVTFYKSTDGGETWALINTVAQANNFGGSATAVSIGAAAFATANQWIGKIFEPRVGVFVP